MHSENIKKSNKAILAGFFFLLLSLVLLDQSTKYLSEKKFLISSSTTQIHDYLARSQSVFHIGGDNWLNFSLTYVRNTGAAWGFLGNLPENIRPYFFYVLTAVAMLFILYFFFKTSSKQFFTRLGIALIFSGAMGNYIDRLWLHYVIDWIHFEWKVFSWQYDYPVFNVADCCVTGGVLVLILETLVSEIKTRFFKPKTPST